MNLTIFVLFGILIVIVPSSYAVLRLDNESELREAQAAIFNIHSQTGWLLLKYVGPNTVHFAAGGEGTTADFKDLLADNEIGYVVLRVPDKKRPRDVFIQWIGPNVGNIERAKKQSHLGDAELLLSPYVASITVFSKANLNDATVIDRSNPRSSSHIID